MNVQFEVNLLFNNAIGVVNNVTVKEWIYDINNRFNMMKHAINEIYTILKGILPDDYFKDPDNKRTLRFLKSKILSGELKAVIIDGKSCVYQNGILSIASNRIGRALIYKIDADSCTIRKYLYDSPKEDQVTVLQDIYTESIEMLKQEYTSSFIGVFASSIYDEFYLNIIRRNALLIEEITEFIIDKYKIEDKYPDIVIKLIHCRPNIVSFGNNYCAHNFNTNTSVSSLVLDYGPKGRTLKIDWKLNKYSFD